MNRLFTLLFLSPALLSAQPAAGCFPVDQERIYGRDLAAAAPSLAGLPEDLLVAYAPTPGVPRFFELAELERLAKKYGLAPRFSAPICFAWPLHVLTADSVRPSLLASLSGREAELEIMRQSTTPVPIGDVVFPLDGLSGGDGLQGLLWSGYVRYAGDRRFAIWARVRITVQEDRLVATRNIRLGERLEETDYRTIRYRGPLQSSSLLPRSAPLHEASQVAGQTARQPIAAGAILSSVLLSPLQDVVREQVVVVHTDFGAAHIQTQGIAVQGGYRGQVIRVRNPKTGRVFLARIGNEGSVTVVPGGEAGLVVEDRKS